MNSYELELAKVRLQRELFTGYGGRGVFSGVLLWLKEQHQGGFGKSPFAPSELGEIIQVASSLSSSVGSVKSLRKALSDMSDEELHAIRRELADAEMRVERILFDRQKERG